ncbi:hypothetical protein DAH63_17660, partial [Sphingomonas koreensis]
EECVKGRVAVRAGGGDADGAGVKMNDFDNETWLIEAGDEVIEKQASIGMSLLTNAERLIYCLWVADYGMRNAGDLETARDLFEPFQAQGREAAAELNLSHTLSLFSLPREEMERDYFDLFDEVCAEIRKL